MSLDSPWLNPLALISVLAFVSCGGITRTESGASAGSGAAEPEAGGDGGASKPPPATDTVSIAIDDAAPIIHTNPKATCIPGFEGFTTEQDGLSIEVEAFIEAPGRHEGDSIHLLYLDVRRPDGSDYCATAGSPSCFGGSIILTARTLQPRFTGEVEAELVNRSDPAAPMLKVAVEFDIVPGCSREVKDLGTAMPPERDE